MTTQPGRHNLPRRAVQRARIITSSSSSSASTVSPPILDVSPSQTLLSSSPYTRALDVKDDSQRHRSSSTLASKPLLPEYHSAQPYEIEPQALQAIRITRATPQSRHNLTNLPKRRTPAQLAREKKLRRCCRPFARGTGCDVSVAFDAGNSGTAEGGEEEGPYDYVVRIAVAPPEDEKLTAGPNDPKPEPFRTCASPDRIAPHVPFRLYISHAASTDDSGTTLLSKDQCSVVAEQISSHLAGELHPDGSRIYSSAKPPRILITAPTIRAVDALSCASFITAFVHLAPPPPSDSYPQLGPSDTSEPVSPLSLLLSFNASLDTALDIPSCKEEWSWRGSVSRYGMEHVERWIRGNDDDEEEYLYESAYTLETDGRIAGPVSSVGEPCTSDAGACSA